METKNELKAKIRKNFGKGFARRERQVGNIPAIIYVKGKDSKHIVVNYHDAMLLLRQTNILINININNETIQVLPRDIQRNAVSRKIEHIDFITVEKGATINVDVEINIVGEAITPAIAIANYNTVEIEADMQNIPEKIDVSVDGLVEGDSIKSTDIRLPEGSKFTNEEEFTIISVTVPKEEEPEQVSDETEESTESAESTDDNKDEDNNKDADNKTNNQDEKSSDDKSDNKNENKTENNQNVEKK